MTTQFEIIKNAVDQDEKKVTVDTKVAKIKDEITSEEERDSLLKEVDVLGKDILPSILLNVITNKTYAHSAALESESGGSTTVKPDFWEWMIQVNEWMQNMSTWQKAVKIEFSQWDDSKSHVDLKNAIEKLNDPGDPPQSIPTSIISKLYIKTDDSK